MRRIVVYAGTRNVRRAMLTAAKSLLTNTRVDRVIMLADTDRFAEQLPREIEVIDVRGQRIFPETGPNYSTRWTYMTLLRLALPRILPEEDRALWLDVDTLCVGDIGELFETDLGGCCVGMVREPPYSRPGRVYYNAGVLLMDLAGMRAEGTADALIDRVNTVKLEFSDQDALNDVCAGRICDLDPVWNASDWTAHPPDPKIIHFAANRNYQADPLWTEWELRPWPKEAEQ